MQSYGCFIIFLRDKLYQLGEGVYYNEPDYHLENWQEEYWGGNYERLQSVKTIWDPENFFSCHMCVTLETPREHTSNGLLPKNGASPEAACGGGSRGNMPVFWFTITLVCFVLLNTYN